MSSLSQALRLEDLPSSHSAFQGHAAHIIEWPTMLRPKDSEGPCIPSGVTTFLQAASRRSLRSDYYGPFDCLQGLGAFGAGLPCLLPTLLVIPFRLSRVHNRGLKQDGLGRFPVALEKECNMCDYFSRTKPLRGSCYPARFAP